MTSGNCKGQKMGRSPKKSTHCAVVSCPSPVRVSYHNFPKDAKLRKIWLKACGRATVQAKASVCAQHFKQEDFKRDLRNELLGLPVRGLLNPGWSLHSHKNLFAKEA